MDIKQTTIFKKDIKRCKKQGKNINNIMAIINTLVIPDKLEAKNKQHKLHGDFEGWEECHITPDWLLVYRYYDGYLELLRTGSHSEIFGK